MNPAHRSRARVSVRLIWPFARLVGNYPQGLPSLSRVGVGLAEYANPDTRVLFSSVIEMLNDSIRLTGDPALGLRAGELIESGDFDALEYAARSCATLRDAVHCIARHARLMNDAIEITLVEEEDHAIVGVHFDDDMVVPPAINDFVVAVLMNHMRQQTGRSDMVEEVRFTHGPTSYLEEYQRVFRTRVSFNQAGNAIVSRRESLELPMIRANPRLSAAFELHARQLLLKLQQTDTVGGKTRALVLDKLRQGDVKMQTVARALNMSVATLRRHLQHEGLSFSEIVEQLRKELSRRYLRERERSIREVAFLLGFSDVVPFHNAFKRWNGMTPGEFRARAFAQGSQMADQVPVPPHTPAGQGEGGGLPG